MLVKSYTRYAYFVVYHFTCQVGFTATMGEEPQGDKYPTKIGSGRVGIEIGEHI